MPGALIYHAFYDMSFLDHPDDNEKEPTGACLEGVERAVTLADKIRGHFRSNQAVLSQSTSTDHNQGKCM